MGRALAQNYEGRCSSISHKPVMFAGKGAQVKIHRNVLGRNAEPVAELRQRQWLGRKQVLEGVTFSLQPTDYLVAILGTTLPDGSAR